VATLRIVLLMLLAQAIFPALAAERCTIQLSSMDSHSSLAGWLSSAIEKQVSHSPALTLAVPRSAYDLDIRIVRTRLIDLADRHLPPSATPPDFLGFYVLLDRHDRFLQGSVVLCKDGADSCAGSVLILAAQVCGARPNNSFKPKPLRGSA
jgi:hypothetical protein